MSTRRAFLVLGPESSGTRLLTRIFINAGCYGDAGDVQRLDEGLTGESMIVWRRSVPHNRAWPDITEMIADLRAAEYEVQSIVTSRDWAAMTQSQASAGHVPSPEAAIENLWRVYPFITGQLAAHHVPYFMVSYDSLVQRPAKVLRWLSRQTGTTLPVVEIYDGNAKWYGEA